MALGGSFAVLISIGALSWGGVSWGGVSFARADEPPAAAAASALPPEEVERQAEAISRSIMSPFCPGRTVSACPVAGPWRDDIRKWVGEGVDADEIKRRLAERAPEHNLMGAPKNRLGWALPLGLGALAVGVLVFLLRYLVSPRAAGQASSGTKPAGAKPAEAPPPEAKPAGAGAKPAEPTPRAKANTGANASPAVASRANGEDYDARLEQELDTFEQ
jgi:cytochrome c-type biogenesis protein CcmH/NrfF